MRFYSFILGVHPLLILIFVSYFWLLSLNQMPIHGMTFDLTVLGVIAALLSFVVFSRRFPPVVLSAPVANRLLLCSTALLGIATPYLLVKTDWQIEQLLDARFQLSGFGILSSLYLVATMVGSCVFLKADGRWLKTLFILFGLYVGVIVGGKGFFGPVLFGISLALSLHIYRVSRFKFLLLSLALMTTLIVSFLQRSDSMSEALELATVRVVLSADSVQWVSNMTPSEITEFPVSTISFLADIPLRFVGLRINPRSVGSEIAYTVAGDDSGGGPNANLPTMAYLLGHGSLIVAMTFMLTIFLISYISLRAARMRAKRGGASGILYSAVILLAPTVVIDMVVFLQYAFWLALVGAVVGRFALRDSRRLADRTWTQRIGNTQIAET